MHKSHRTNLPEAREEQLHILIKGIVQGVGFRPFVHNLARELHLAGQVANTGKGVKIRVRGTGKNLRFFLDHLQKSAPAASRIDAIKVQPDREALPGKTFTIIASENGESATLISPDLATCDDCLAEILNPSDRRFDYPFTNCTNCGPRLTIIRKIPYDRPHTSMAGFSMCPECKREYEDPGDRRFHAQPNACPACGPRVSWHDRDGALLGKGSTKVLDACAQALARGAIVAIKGLGGFHLAVDATSAQAVARLRRKKKRPDKPLAVMVRDLAALKRKKICRLEPAAEELLQRRERPIVLLPKSGLGLDEPLAPGMAVLGVMLPYTPLHHLLLARRQCPEMLVMTSGNKSGAPICAANGEAILELADIADFFLLHNREIVTRVDDSVARMAAGKARLIRRARGHAPLPFSLPKSCPPILACGAELKNTFCLTRKKEAFVSQHIGDLKSPDTMAFFEESIQAHQHLLDCTPSMVVRDLHPDYLSSRHADGTALPAIKVQHHQAHAGAVMAEHGLDECLAVVYDGAGLGEDGTIWGGEIFYIRQGRCLRLAHLRPFPLPGGDRATRETWRIGLSLLHEAGLASREPSCLPAELAKVDAGKRKTVLAMIQKGVNAPPGSSMGRLFDGIASLLGIRQQTSFEAQAAMELESLALMRAGTRHPAPPLPTPVFQDDGTTMLMDHRPLVRWLLEQRKKGMEAALLALAFHHWLARMTVELIAKVHQEAACLEGKLPIVLSGGCFQNLLLLELITGKLEESGYRVYSGEQIPVNDGGIALGQAWLAGKRLEGTTLNQGGTHVSGHSHAGC